MTEDKKSVDFQSLVRVIGLAKPYKNIFIFAGLLSVTLAPVSAIRPWLVNKMVDDHIMVSDLPGLYKMAGIFGLVVLLTVALRYAFIYSTSLLGQNVIRDLRVNVFDQIVSLKLRYFDQTPIGKSTTRTINDIETINTIFTQGLVTMIADILGIFAVLGIMFYTSWQLTLISLSTIPLLLIATYIFKEKVKVAYEKVRSQLAEMNAFLQERITGMKIVQIFTAEKQEMAKFKSINRKYTQANLDSILYYAVFFPVVEIIEYATLALIVWWGAKWFCSDILSFGVLIAFPMYISMLFRPIRMLADKFNTLQMGLVAANRVFEVIDQREHIANNGYLTPSKVKGHIQFEDVSFAYDEENYVINNLDLEIKPEETLAIVGSTGSGKTTIINILNRFYDIQSGTISLDGQDIRKYTLDNLRQRISIVLQDVFLFTGTVMENITLKDQTIDKAKVIEASKAIGAHEFIISLPEGYDYVVMERGNNLSMGQRQLISFVRALVFDPDVLILDEATSSIDKETEKVIQHAIETLITKRTSIIIAHRLSTIKHADKILVMDHGRKLEFGSHNELIQNADGKYKELYDMQFIKAEEQMA